MANIKNENIKELLEGVVYSDEVINKKIKKLQTLGVSHLRVCSYGRVSTKYDEQVTSLESQHEIFNRYCDQRFEDGFILVEEVYEQESAKSREHRDKFNAMIDRALNGKYDLLLFKDSKRFSRHTDDYLGLIEELYRKKIGVVFIYDSVNTLENYDRMQLTMLGAMAENYSNTLHHSVSAAIHIRFNSELGRVPSGVYGYVRNPNNSALADIVPEQADALRELFDRYASGEGLASIRDDFNSRGLKTYRGVPFCVSTMRTYIRNELYKGVLIMNKFSKTDVRNKREPNPPEEWIVRERPDLKIVEPEVWDECNRIMDTNRRVKESQGCFHQSETDKLKSMLFQHVIVCGECGRYYNRKKAKTRSDGFEYVYLMCAFKRESKRNQINKPPCSNEEVIRLDTLIEVISKYLESIVKNSEQVQEYIREKIISKLDEKRKEINKLTQDDDIQAAKDKLGRLTDLYKEGLIDKSEVIAQKKVVADMLKTMQASGVKFMSKNEIDEYTLSFISHVADISSQYIAGLQGEEAKAFNGLFDSIVINNDSIDIKFKTYMKLTEPIRINDCLDESVKNFHLKLSVIQNEVSRIELKTNIENGVIQWSDLSPKDRKRVRRKYKLGTQLSTRTMQVMGYTKEHIVNMHTNQVIKSLRDIQINVFIV